MKYLHWIGIVTLILIMGYLSALGLFADSGLFAKVSLILIFLVGSAGVGALIPERWPLSALCSWGALLFIVLEIGSRIGRGNVAGQQPFAQLIFTGLGVVALALAGGYAGSRLGAQMRSRDSTPSKPH